MISIITATYNAEKNISKLINSLLEQTDKRFEWIIVDGNSSDNTINIINNVKNIDIKLISEKDNGIYDALNKGLKLAKYKYYLVCGSDDVLFKETVSNINKKLSYNKLYDFYAFSFIMVNKMYTPNKYFGWLYGMRGIATCHSVALLINKNLHNIYGYYNTNYPIFADQLFVLKSIHCGAKIQYCKEIVSGEYSTEGMSSINSIDRQIEYFRMQLSSGSNFYLQFFLFTIRLLKFKFLK